MYYELADDSYYDKLYAELVKHGLNLIHNHEDKGSWYRYQSCVLMFAADGLPHMGMKNVNDPEVYGYENEGELLEEWFDIRQSFMDDKLSFDDMYDKYCRNLWLSHPWFYYFFYDTIEAEKHALKLQKDI